MIFFLFFPPLNQLVTFSVAGGCNDVSESSCWDDNVSIAAGPPEAAAS